MTISARRLFDQICNDVYNGTDQRAVAAKFHHAVTRMIAGVCEIARDRFDIDTVGLTGGVFQNARLVREIQDRTGDLEVPLRLHRRIPCNDAAIAFGQVVEHAAQAGGATQ